MRISAPIAASVALCANAGALAQGQRSSVIDSNIPRRPSVIKEDKAGPIRKEFARCVYHRRGAAVDVMLRHSDPMVIDYKAIGTTERGFGEKISMPECLAETSDITAVNTRMSMSRQNMRSLLLEEAYLARGNQAAVQPVQGAPRIYVSDESKLPQARGLGEYADCIVARDATGADALLRTMPGSPQEGQKSRALVPVLRTCLTNGQTISFTPASIRGLAADGLWQRFEAGPALLPAAAPTVGQR